MMSRLVENRGVILQNDMNQRWASIYEREALLNGLLEQHLDSEGADLATLLLSDEMREALLERLFPECLDILQGSASNGLFLVLTDLDAGAAGSTTDSLSGIPIPTQIPSIIRTCCWSGEQRALQGLEYSAGHQLDTPVPHGRPGCERIGSLFL